jgi:hypothetical protein
LIRRLNFSCKRSIAFVVREPLARRQDKNRDRLPEGEIAAKFLSAVLAQPGVKRLLNAEHFSVDCPLIEAWASMKSFKPTDGPNEPPARG